MTLGVAFEAAMLCDVAQGLSYTWTFTDSAGSQVPLPPAVHVHGQTITVPGYTLEPGNYTALAKVGRPLPPAPPEQTRPSPGLPGAPDLLCPGGGGGCFYPIPLTFL